MADQNRDGFTLQYQAALDKREIVLRVKDLTVEYVTDDEVAKAVNHVSFELRSGSTLGLVGETGAGKTTIAKAVLGVLPDVSARICGGEILFNGSDLLELSEMEMQKIRGNQISMIFQDPMTALNPTMKIGDQIKEAIMLHEKLSHAEGEKRAVDMLEMVGIPGERYSDYPHQFSGGMKQRVVIAIALACKPQLLIADEPTTALDVTIQAQVLDMMMKLKMELGTSVIMITHDLGIIAETCDYVAVIYSGEVVECGTSEDIFDYASHPYTVGLFASLPSRSGKGERLKPIKGMMPDPADLPEGCPFAERCLCPEKQCFSTKPEYLHLSDTHIVKCYKRWERQ